MRRSLIVKLKDVRENAKQTQEKREQVFQLAEEVELAQELALEEKRKQEEEFLTRLGGKDEQKYRSKKDPDVIFDSLIACREHIYEHSLIGIPCESLEQRMNLGKEVYEDEVDGQIEVRLMAKDEFEEEWVSFNEHWEKIYPFNQFYKTPLTLCNRKKYCEHCQNNGNRVYVLRFQEKKHIYVGGTGKCMYWRYFQHCEGEKSRQNSKLTHKYDQKQGLRWDLMHKFYSDEHLLKIPFNSIEKWLSDQLVSCGYKDDGDGGKPLKFS